MNLLRCSLQGNQSKISPQSSLIKTWNTTRLSLHTILNPISAESQTSVVHLHRQWTLKHRWSTSTRGNQGFLSPFSPISSRDSIHPRWRDLKTIHRVWLRVLKDHQTSYRLDHGKKEWTSCQEIMLISRLSTSLKMDLALMKILLLYISSLLVWLERSFLKKRCSFMGAMSRRSMRTWLNRGKSRYLTCKIREETCSSSTTWSLRMWRVGSSASWGQVWM